MTLSYEEPSFIETTEFLYQSGAKEVHVRPACPPLLFGCKFLNFSRSKSELDLITRRIIQEREEEVTGEVLEEYANPCCSRYHDMVEEVRRRQNFTTLRYHRLDDPGCIDWAVTVQTLYVLL